MTKTIMVIRGFLETLNNVEKDWDYWVEELQLCEQEIQDLLHEIELTKFDYRQGNKLCRQLQKARQHRRQLKDKKEIMRYLREFVNNNQQMKISLYKTLTNMERVKECQGRRMYTPRVRTDLAERLG